MQRKNYKFNLFVKEQKIIADILVFQHILYFEDKTQVPNDYIYNFSRIAWDDPYVDL